MNMDPIRLGIRNPANILAPGPGESRLPVRPPYSSYAFPAGDAAEGEQEKRYSQFA